MHRPADVAHVTLDLAEDRRHRIGRERRPAIGIEAVHGLHQREARDLHEILERLRRVAVASGEAAREWQVALDQLGPRPLRLRAAAELGEQLLDRSLPPARAGGHRPRRFIALVARELTES